MGPRRSGVYKPGSRTRANGFKGSTGWPKRGAAAASSLAAIKDASPEVEEASSSVVERVSSQVVEKASSLVVERASSPVAEKVSSPVVGNVSRAAVGQALTPVVRKKTLSQVAGKALSPVVKNGALLRSRNASSQAPMRKKPAGQQNELPEIEEIFEDRAKHRCTSPSTPPKRSRFSSSSRPQDRDYIICS